MILVAVLYIILEHTLFLIFIATCYFSSDKLLKQPKVNAFPWRRALVDNSCHISLGFISWLIVISVEEPHKKWNLTSCMLCGLSAGLVDVDHFIQAKSFYIEDAVNLQVRPFMHNTTLMFFTITSFMALTHYTYQKKLEYFSWTLLTAVMSHHVRDSLHRGLWLWPIASAPFSYFTCIVATYFFSAFIGYLRKILHNPTTSADFSIV